MRLTACLFAIGSLLAALPPDARAQEERPPRAAPVPPPAAGPRPAQPTPGTPPPAVVPRTVPGPYPRTVPAPYPRYGRPYYAPYAPYYYRPSFWWGWGWGWGWYPLYGYPGYAPAPGYAPVIDERYRVYTRFSMYGGWASQSSGRDDGYVGGVEFGLDSRFVGFDLDVTAVARESVTGPLYHSGSDPATWATGHITWSILSQRYFRLRIETGGSMLSLPNSTAVSLQEWRGKTLYGPDVGVSGQLGIVGPLGIEGHARLTPIPTRVADTLIAATVHGGPLGLSAGWRWIDVAGNGRDAPKLTFRGPQVALSLAF